MKCGQLVLFMLGIRIVEGGGLGRDMFNSVTSGRWSEVMVVPMEHSVLKREIKDSVIRMWSTIEEPL